MINKQAVYNFEKDTLELVQICLDNKNPTRAIQVLKHAQQIRELIAKQYKNISLTGLEA